MRMSTIALVAGLLAAIVDVGAAHAQSITAEASASAGITTDEASAGAAQLRVYGDLAAGIRYFAEAAWADIVAGETDAFGSAYPYLNRVQAIEAYGERVFRPGRALAGVRAGRYRTPFGIYNASDHAYVGFLRAPFIRYDDSFALSNNFLEHGADVIVGVPRLTVETSLGTPADVGEAPRRSGLDTVVRAQGFYGPLIAGISYSRTLPNQPVGFGSGRATFTGVDLRWTHNGIQLRGEWLDGQPFDGATTMGWYADAIVHRVGMGPVTILGRVERLAHDAPVSQLALHQRRQTIGARIYILEGLSVQANLLHNTGHLDSDDHRVTLDVGVTYSIRRQAHGAQTP